MVSHCDLRAEAEACFERGELAAALRRYRRLVAIEPADAELLNDLGTVLYAMGSVRESCRCYLRALQLDAEHPQARENLRRACEGAGLSAFAVVQALGEVAASPARIAVPQPAADGAWSGVSPRASGTAEGPDGRIEDLFEQGRYEEAYRLALRRVRDDVFDAGAWNDLAVVALEVCRKGEALGAIQRARELAPTHRTIDENATVIQRETQGVS